MLKNINFCGGTFHSILNMLEKNNLKVLKLKNN